VYADAIAQILFESVPLPECRTRETWESLWRQVDGRVQEFLSALARHVSTPALAADALVAMKQMALKASPTWGTAIDGAEARVRAAETRVRDAEAQARALEDRISALENRIDDYERRVAEYDGARAQQQRRAETAELERDRVAAELRSSEQQAGRLRDERNEAEAHIELLERMRWLKLGRATGVLKVPPYKVTPKR
jgi:predicted RNase H-like nuclease (RuvC/YqgF family)